MKNYHKNPRQITDKQLSYLKETLDELGDLSGIVHDLNSDEIIGGNQRGRAFNINHCEVEIVGQYDEPDAQGTVAHGFVVWRGNRYAYRQVRWTPRQCEKANVVANKGGGSWDFDILANEFDTTDLLDWGFEEWEFGIEEDNNSDTGVEDGKQPKNRILPIDVIYTQANADATCCIAVQAGMQYGIQSGNYRVCPYHADGFGGRHKIQFIDNDYFDYDHKKHVDVVREYKPKYVTTRDYMSVKQCKSAGIEYYELSQILEWAEELNEYAENVIIIPKVDIIDKIPEKYVLGYSIPTSHGGTEIHVDAFRGRRIHLLGGSWGKQLSFMAELGDDVVSLDNNYIWKQTLYGSFVFPDGRHTQIVEEFGEEYKNLTNHMHVAFAMSCGFIGHKIQELYNEKDDK